MQKLITLIAIVASCLAVAYAANLKEADEVKQGARDALSRGLSRFSGLRKESVNEENVPATKPDTSKVFTHYTRRIPGRWQAWTREPVPLPQLRPTSPSVLPVEHPNLPNGKLTPEAAAKIYVPQRPYQLTKGHLY